MASEFQLKERSETRGKWWNPVVSTARQYLPYADYFLLDPDRLSQEKLETRSLLGGVLGILVPVLIAMYFSVLFIDNQNAPSSQSSQIEPAVLVPPVNLSAPGKGYLVTANRPGTLPCDTVLKKLIGKQLDYIPVCPNAWTGLAYEVAKEDGIVRVSRPGGNYGIDVSVESRKQITVDENGHAYIVGKHKPLRKSSADEEHFYFSRLDDSSGAWDDLGTTQKWQCDCQTYDLECCTYDNAKFTEWVDGYQYLALVMQESIDDRVDNTILRVWKRETEEWANNTVNSLITAVALLNNGQQLILAQYDAGSRSISIAQVKMSFPQLGFDYTAYSDLAQVLWMSHIEDMVEWDRYIAVIGQFGDYNSQRRVVIWDRDLRKINSTIDIFSARWEYDGDNRGVLLVYQTKLFVGGWNVEAIDTRLAFDGLDYYTGCLFALDTTGTIITGGDPLSIEGVVHSFVVRGTELLALDKHGLLVVDPDTLDVSRALEKKDSIDDCMVAASGHLYCIGQFPEIEDTDGTSSYVSGIFTDAGYDLRSQWSPIRPLASAWHKEGYNSEPNAMNQYSFGPSSIHAEPLRLSPEKNTIQIPATVEEFFPANPTYTIFLTFNKYIVSLEEVKDNIIGETYGIVQASEPDNLVNDFWSVTELKNGEQSIRLHSQQDESECVFAPANFEDFKEKCKDRLPMNFPIVVDDQWPVMMMTYRDGKRKWIELAKSPSSLRLVFFEGLQMKIKREVHSNKQSAAALFGQAAGTLSILLTGAHLLKVALTKVAKKWNERKKEVKQVEWDGDNGSISINNPLPVAHEGALTAMPATSCPFTKPGPERRPRSISQALFMDHSTGIAALEARKGSSFAES